MDWTLILGGGGGKGWDVGSPYDKIRNSSRWGGNIFDEKLELEKAKINSKPKKKSGIYIKLINLGIFEKGKIPWGGVGG